MSDASRASTFLAEFNIERDAISTSIESLLTSGSSISAQDVQPIAARLNALSASATEAMTFLPAYDQRLCSQKINALESGIDQLRQKIPKARFAFKKRAPAPASASASPTPDVATPILETKAPVETTSTSASSSAASRTNAYINFPALTSSSDVILSALDSCIVDLLSGASGSPILKVTALYAKGLRRCVILASQVDGSVRFEDCVDCVVFVASRQFRMERCRSTDVYLHVKSLPVIEDSKGIRFSAYPLPDAPAYESQHTSAKDFSWIQETPSPNWSHLADGGRDWKAEVLAMQKQRLDVPEQAESGFVEQKIMQLIGS